jgi:hypothetical protein
MLKWVEKLTPGKQARAWRSSLERQTSHGETEAQRLLKGGLAKSGMTRKQLLESKSTARVKVELAKLLRQKTTVSQSWLAENLGMKSAANVGQILNRETKATQLSQPTKKKRTNPAQLPKSFSEWLQDVKLCRLTPIYPDPNLIKTHLRADYLAILWQSTLLCLLLGLCSLLLLNKEERMMLSKRLGMKPRPFDNEKKANHFRASTCEISSGVKIRSRVPRSSAVQSVAVRRSIHCSSVCWRMSS